MGVSVRVSSYDVVNERVVLDITLTGESNSGDAYYIDMKNTDSSHYCRLYTGSISSGAMEELSMEFTMGGIGRAFTGSSKTFKVTWKGQSGTASATLPMKYTQPSYTISERPIQQTQFVTYNGVVKGEAGCCVANTTVSCVEVLKMRTGNTVYPYSVGWVFGGAGDGVNDYLNYVDTLNFLKSNGIPPAQVLTSDYVTGYPDIYYQADAKKLYNNNYSTNLKYATPQRIGSWTKLTSDASWNYESIFNAIKRENTTVMVTLNINQALDDASNTGWVSTIKGSQRGGHSMIVLGWVENTGKYYWICQNSWCTQNGTPLGDNGIYYLPFDHFTYDGMGIFDFYALTRDENAPTMPAIPENTGMPVLASRLFDGFNLMCNAVANATYEFRYRKEGTTTYSTKSSTTNTVSITGLEYGYTYLLSVRFLRSGIYSPYSQESQCTVLPDCPTIDAVYSTNTSNLIVKLRENSITGKYSYLQIWRRNAPWSSSNNTIDTKNVPNLQTLTEWTGLQKGMKYAFSVIGVLEVNGTALQSYYRSTAIEGIVGNLRPTYFSWDTPKIKGQPINVTASEWNRLTQNINAMLTFKGKGSKVFTTAYPNMKITATIFNEAKNAIYLTTGLNSSVSIPSATTWFGTPVVITAEHFNKLVESLNSVT